MSFGQLTVYNILLRRNINDIIEGPRGFSEVRWRNDRVKVTSELTQDRRAWSGYDDSTRRGMPSQVHVE